MGVITDFVIAEPREATDILEVAAPVQRWRGLEAKTIDTIKLSTLAFILSGKPLDIDAVVAYSMSIKVLATESEEGPWVFLVPEELVLKLASTSKSDLAEAGKLWHQTEEFQLDGWAETDVAKVLTDLHKLASESRSSQKSLLLFISL